MQVGGSGAEALLRQPRTAVGVVVDALADIFLRDLQPQRVAGAVEARQAIFRNGGALARG